jgi:hypothetical protein
MIEFKHSTHEFVPAVDADMVIVSLSSRESRCPRVNYVARVWRESWASRARSCQLCGAVVGMPPRSRGIPLRAKNHLPFGQLGVL